MPTNPSLIVSDAVAASTPAEDREPIMPVRAERRSSADSERAVPVVRNADLRDVSHSAEMALRPRSERALRMMNVLIASTALIAASPVIVVVAALVRLTSPGPIIYSQARVGINRRRTTGADSYDRRQRDLGGEPFMIYKFRTMRVGAEQRGAAVWATRGDSRVTPLGRVMRKYRLDELPQLLNVIRGEMNIVGPRPERPSIFSRLSGDIAEYPLRQAAKPGITGWAQVNHDYDTTVDDVRTKVRYDLEYLKRQGLAEDLKIMARTLPVIIFRRGGW